MNSDYLRYVNKKWRESTSCPAPPRSEDSTTATGYATAKETKKRRNNIAYHFKHYLERLFLIIIHIIKLIVNIGFPCLLIDALLRQCSS